MIKSRVDLEEKILQYSPKLRAEIERRPEARGKLEEIAGKQFENYKPFIGGKADKAGKVGRGFGYLGDAVFFASAIAAASNPLLAPYMLTGLLLKKANAVAQVPETAKSVKYIAKTGDVAGGIRNIGAKALSYVPGLTVVDRGLSRIAEKRMVKKATYEVERAFEVGEKSWYEKTADEAKEAGYKGVKVRSENIVGPRKWKDKEPLRKAA